MRVGFTNWTNKIQGLIIWKVTYIFLPHPKAEKTAKIISNDFVVAKIDEFASAMCCPTLLN